MRSTQTVAVTCVLAALATAGCGSGGTRTVSVSGDTTSSATTAASPPPLHSRSTKSEPTQATGQTQTTRTATAPAFTKEPANGDEDLSKAEAVVKAHGYTPDDPSQYRSDQTLRVLVATRTGSADGYAQQTFFFVDGRYIGTDTSGPSAGIRLVSQNDTEATLAYRLYRPGDPLCCARGGEADVRFQLNDGRLTALDPIPPVDSSNGTSRQ